MLESVHCPTCSAHYGLRASRVRTGLRRARCFRCFTDFSIEQEVLRLTSGSDVQPLVQPIVEEVGIGPDDLMDLQSMMEEAPHAEAEPSVISAPAEAPSLTLGDLEGVEEDILAMEGHETMTARYR